MAYEKTPWTDGSTALSAEHMNHIENGIKDAHDAIELAMTKELVLDVFYPVGSFYETSDTEFNPGTAWGGTWVLEEAGRVHVSAGTGYAAGSKGGNKDAVIPYHTHTLSRTADVGVAAHGITQPAFSVTGGSIANGITGGSHVHKMQGWRGLTGGGSGSAKEVRSREKVTSDPQDTNNPIIASTHTHTLPAHTHTVSRTTNVALTNNHSVTQPNFSAAYAGTNGNTTNANMQPYIVVNRWHRTA